MDTPEYELGPKLHTYGINHWELLRWFLLIVPILFLVMGVFSGSFTSGLLQMALLFAGIVALAKLFENLYPYRLIICERGIISERGKQKRRWRWGQLTNMTGVRHTQYVNGIPLFRTGANHFFAGNEAAFDVTWWTAEPNRTMQYIFMKMIERDVPTYVQAYKQGQTIRFGSLFMNGYQIGGSRATVNWTDVKLYRWKKQTLSIVSRSDGREIILGSLEPPELYCMMGVLDAVLGTQTYAKYQLNYLKGPTRLLGVERRVMLIAGAVAALVLISLVGINLLDMSSKWRADQARNELAIRYGSESFTVCANAHDKSNRGSTAKSEHKFIVVNTDQGVNINTTFQDTLKKTDIAESKTDLTAIICLKPDKVEVESCPYGDETVTNFYIHRYQSTYTVSLVDLITGKTFASTVIAGELPEECPDRAKASKAKDIYGPSPDPGKLVRFLERVKSAPSDENAA